MTLAEVRRRSDLPQWLWDQGYRVGAEIGVYKGEFSRLLLLAGLEVYSIDPWMPYLEEASQRRHDAHYRDACRMTAPFGARAHLIRKMSTDAAPDFADGSLDFVYIDGNHKAPYILADLQAWSPKVRPGGVVAGHDYAGPSSREVKPVVDAWAQEHGYTLHLIGPPPKDQMAERGDKWTSFAWVV